MVIISMMVLCNAIENWMRDKTRSRLCNESLNSKTYQSKP